MYFINDLKARHSREGVFLIYQIHEVCVSFLMPLAVREGCKKSKKTKLKVYPQLMESGIMHIVYYYYLRLQCLEAERNSGSMIRIKTTWRAVPPFLDIKDSLKLLAFNTSSKYQKFRKFKATSINYGAYTHQANTKSIYTKSINYGAYRSPSSNVFVRKKNEMESPQEDGLKVPAFSSSCQDSNFLARQPAKLYSHCCC